MTPKRWGGSRCSAPQPAQPRVFQAVNFGRTVRQKDFRTLRALASIVPNYVLSSVPWRVSFRKKRLGGLIGRGYMRTAKKGSANLLDACIYDSFPTWIIIAIRLPRIYVGEIYRVIFPKLKTAADCGHRSEKTRLISYDVFWEIMTFGDDVLTTIDIQ